MQLFGRPAFLALAFIAVSALYLGGLDVSPVYLLSALLTASFGTDRRNCKRLAEIAGRN